MSTDRPSLVDAAKTLSEAVNRLRFGAPTAYVYNPLDYAWEAHRCYLERWGAGRKRVVFLGMNPGPWGMAQTGVPFGEVCVVREWLDIVSGVNRPPSEHPKRPIEGFACRRSEVSGRRLWGLFRYRFGEPGAFFENHFVLNYCPLVFMEESGRNRTPDKLPGIEKEPLGKACDEFLFEALELLDPEYCVGIGAYAEGCLQRIAGDKTVSRILHPSPASPAANQGWAEVVSETLVKGGIWY